jgi:CheY-like chemotaxis protein
MPRVLIADDEPYTRLSLSIILHRAHFEVVEADNGKDALQLVLEAHQNQQPFDLVILDHLMPGKTGVEVIETIKKAAFKQRFLLTTAYLNDDVRTYLISNPQAQLLEKPYSPEEFLERVHKALNNGNGR